MGPRKFQGNRSVGEILFHLARYLVYAKLVYHRLGGTKILLQWVNDLYIFLRQEPKLNLHYQTLQCPKAGPKL